MSNPNSSDPRQNSESKGGQSFLLYMVLATVGVALLAMFMLNRIRPEMRYQQFERLVMATSKLAATDDRPAGYGEIKEDVTQDGKSRKVRYSNIRDVVVGERVIRFSADVEHLDAPTAAELHR